MDTAIAEKDKIDQEIALPYTISNILKMRLSGKTYPEIATYFNKTKQCIQQRCKGVLEKIDSEKLQAYQTHEPEILETVKSILIDNMVNPDKLEKASINNLAYTFDQISKELHLKRGESTANILSVLITAEELKALKFQSAGDARRIAFDVQDSEG